MSNNQQYRYKQLYDLISEYIDNTDIYKITVNTKDKQIDYSNKYEQLNSLVAKITSLIGKEFISKDPNVVRIATEELTGFYKDKPIYIDAKGFKDFLDTTARIYTEDGGYDTSLFFENWEDYYLNYLYGCGIYKDFS